ncbi:trypsin-like peptidase domain-containing protein [Tissierella sp. MSJ-40]|uniref:Trypsin-like peptidase domain-containing protein n=1 Tax=Tissierella simiarum TaxID=2841534 RepID=A0ABS6E7M7_9FIRM|nr:trypsin-like peptidase domain-containing protein [Tissierella simiarum]MBU5438915.1 trypsin-like peptidase domain-containing protein [Tissierella simiarum]
MDEERNNIEKDNIIETLEYTIYESDEDTSKEDTIKEEAIKKDKPKKKKFLKKGNLMSYLAVALIASIIGGLISAYVGPKYLYGSILPSPNEQQYQTSQTMNITTGDDINTVSAVAKKAMSSVVGITTIEIQRYAFAEREVEGVGSGVIVDSNGYILTNSHVVGDGNAKEITVLFENGDKKPGKVLWNDAALDLAIVKVEETGLPVATLGDSDKLEVGEIAVAIGNPLGLEFQRTVTSGIISGLHRSIRVDENNIIEDLIQTDASINPGNSGGPLLNSKGDVIGINTAKIKTGEGLGFSIPINIVKPIIQQVIKEGTYKTVFIGITGVEVNVYERQLGIDLSIDNGVIVIEVAADSPASKAGLRSGDVIVKIDDQKVENMNQLKKTLYKYSQGDKATLEIIRDGEEKKIEVEFSNLR